MTRTMEMFLAMRDMGVSVNCAELDKMLEKEVKDEVHARLNSIVLHLELRKPNEEQPIFKRAVEHVLQVCKAIADSHGK